MQKGGMTRPYVALSFDSIAAAKNPKVDAVITEGPTRALAGAARGLFVISLLGVTCHGLGDELDPTLAKVNWNGRRVYIAFDCDAQNNKNVQAQEEKLARKLAAQGAQVFIVRIPDIAPGGHAGLDDLLALPGGLETFKALCKAAPVYNIAKKSGNEPIVNVLHDVSNEPVDYIWDGRIARGSLTMFSGDPGSAKTFLALSVSADLTRGRVPLTGAKCKPLRILYASTENSAAHVIGPRFRAMGGDDRNFYLLDGALDAAGGPTGITFGNLMPVERAVEKYKINALFFDPIQAYFGADADFHKANEVRPRMDALTRLAAKYNIAIVLIRHLAKSSGGRAIHKGLGSIDFTGAVRIELMVGNRADNPNDRAIITVKNNLGIFAPALRFAIEGTSMNARLVWKGESALTLGDLLAPETAKRTQSEISKAAEFLRGQLKAGPRLQRDIATDEFSARTLQRAADRIGVSKTRKVISGAGAQGPWEWALPKFLRQGGGDA
jgi:putative DNA primase/helicase